MSSWTTSNPEWLADVPDRFLKALTGPNGSLPRPERTLGAQVCKWIERCCVFGEGDRYGKPVKLEPWQKAFFWKLYELNDDGSRRYQFTLVSLGKGSGKTPLGGWVGSVELAGPCVFGGWNDDGTPRGVRRTSPDILIMASSYDQANMILDELRVTFSEGPLSTFASTQKGRVDLKNGQRGTARRIPATPKQADGSKATTFLVDEAHELTSDKHENAYDVAAGGTAKRADSLTAMFSTAGLDMSTMFGRQVARGLRGDFAEHELFLYLQADEGLDPTNDDDIAEGIRQANPLAASGIVSVPRLVSEFKAMPVYRAKRYFWNQWVPSDESWLPVGAWDKCKGVVEFDPDLPVWIGADLARYRDSAAVVMVQKRPDGKLIAGAKIWFPSGGIIDQDEIDSHLRGLCREFDVQWIAVDPNWWGALSQLEGEGLPIFRMPQSGRNMNYAFTATYQAIVNGTLVHDGAPDFSDQIASAVPKTTNSGWKLEKGKARRRIDASFALAMAVFASEHEREIEPTIPKSRIYI